MNFLYKTYLLIVFIVLTVVCSNAQGNDPIPSSLPPKLNTAIDKILDDQFADIEEMLVRVDSFKANEVLLVTVPLENYIEDVLFTINRPATIYPGILYEALRDLYRQGKMRREIEHTLIIMQKNNQFQKLYESKKQK